MRKYLNIGPHGFNGDFYVCEDGLPFRADDLEIATRIAFNNWLHGFDNLYHSCTLDTIEPGRFTVTITQHASNGASDGSLSRSFGVRYYGPANMFTIRYEYDHCRLPEFREYYEEMLREAESGNPGVRLSGSSGMVMFNIGFPRWRRNGDWWSREHDYLSTDIELAREQMEYFRSSVSEREHICRRNRDAVHRQPEEEMA